MALVLAFHGRLGTGTGQARVSGMDTTSNRHGFIVVYPNGVKRSWNDGLSTPAQQAGVDDVAFVRALIAQLQARYTIDPRRIYVTGLSNGAMFTSCSAASRPARWPRSPGCRHAAGAGGIERAAARRAAVPALPRHERPYVPYDGGAPRTASAACCRRWRRRQRALDGCTGPTRMVAVPLHVRRRHES